MNNRDKVLEGALHDSFVAEAISLKTGIDSKQVHIRLSELIADAFLGRAVQQAGPETAGIVAAIASEMMED